MEIPNPPHFFQNRMKRKNSANEANVAAGIFGLGCFFILGIVLANLIIFGLIITLIIGLCVGNFWFNEDSLMKEAQASNIPVTRVVNMNRGFFNYGEVIFEDADGNRLFYDVNTNIFWNTNLIERD